MEFTHHTVAGILAIHEEVLAAHGGLAGVKDLALLESAIAAPQASFSGQALVQDPLDIAAAYLFHLCQNHPFNDGNKKTALAACLVFLAQNGLFDQSTHLDVDLWGNLVLQVASSQMGKKDLAQEMRNLLPPRIGN
jgi:death-on-curing protein